MSPRHPPPQPVGRSPTIALSLERVLQARKQASKLPRRTKQYDFDPILERNHLDLLARLDPQTLPDRARDYDPVSGTDSHSFHPVSIDAVFIHRQAYR
jgi:hypothetical protein